MFLLLQNKQTKSVYVTPKLVTFKLMSSLRNMYWLSQSKINHDKNLNLSTYLSPCLPWFVYQAKMGLRWHEQEGWRADGKNSEGRTRGVHGVWKERKGNGSRGEMLGSRKERDLEMWQDESVRKDTCEAPWRWLFWVLMAGLSKWQRRREVGDVVMMSGSFLLYHSFRLPSSSPRVWQLGMQRFTFPTFPFKPLFLVLGSLYDLCITKKTYKFRKSFFFKFGYKWASMKKNLQLRTHQGCVMRRIS